MGLVVGDKIYRTLQEQVGYLTELVNELKIIIKDKEYSIDEIYQEDSHLYFKLKDGEVIDAGEIKSIVSVSLDASYHLIVTYTNNTSDDLGLIKWVNNISKNASGHVIVLYNDGTTTDLGLLKGVSSFEINASQHLIVNYDDGTSDDLGAIFNGNLNLAGNLSCVNISASGNITGASIIEDMVGYSFTKNNALNYLYVGACKNGNKLTLTIYGKMNFASTPYYVLFGSFQFPSAVGAKIQNTTVENIGAGAVDLRTVEFWKSASSKIDLKVVLQKTSLTECNIWCNQNLSSIELNTDYLFRYEITLLLGPNLAS